MATISLTFPDGTMREYAAGVTAANVAASISTSLGKKAISATVDGAHWDLTWPIEADATLAIHTMKDTDQALELIRHDFAHVMARAVQEIWPDVKMAIGRVIANGWSCDFDRAAPFVPEDLAKIQTKMRQIIAARDPVRTETWSRAEVIAYYEARNDPFKVALVGMIPEDGQPIGVYRQGDWQDLRREPHLQHTGQLPADAFKLMHVSGAYWRSDSNRAQLQRLYGVAFLNRDQLKQHLRFLREAEKRDHLRLGREMDLFHMQDEAPGQVFWHADGWSIYTMLQDYVRRKQRANGYVEVNTPQVVNRKLWEDCGHWEKYQKHMWIVEVDEDQLREKTINALKPMNCPCHVQIFNKDQKSDRDLPLRMAEFGLWHRPEPSGTLNGIMQLRGFTQDDGHIFCRQDQIESETAAYIACLTEIYTDLGVESFRVKFSDRPATRAGSDVVWDKAEAALLAATRAAGIEPDMTPGKGAFYGPKLEFVLSDAVGRDWQCGTLQVDFVLPERLNATYIAKDGAKHHPVMLHRTTLGAFERFIGILIEQHAGKLPFWIAPRQVVVASIVSDANAFCQDAAVKLRAAGIRAEVDLRSRKITCKIRDHSVRKVPILLAAGRQEVEDGTVTLRRLGEKQTKVIELDTLIADLKAQALPPDLRKRECV